MYSANESEEFKRPNILFLIVDEQRYPPCYETETLKEWRRDNLITQEILREKGLSFINHYVGSTACSPSRTTLFTGHYPSLHGVTQTTGAAKGAFDPNVYWLDSNTVPTLGNYFRTAGYQTFWRGKWHLSDEDILTPGTHNALPSYDKTTGIPDVAKEKLYTEADRLKEYGFNGWIGPEPHGADPRNSGSSAKVGLSGRDEIYAAEVVELIQSLEQNTMQRQKPWLIVSSLVNPHDITLFGSLSRLSPSFNFEIDPSVPEVPPSPSSKENLRTKPKAQASFRDVYQKAFQPTIDSDFYRQLYYSLHKKVDEELFKVYTALANSIFYEDTIIIFTSDHGSLLGAHGGLFQKWHNAYEEALHVPFVIHSPKLFSEPKETDLLTSHVDILPTLLGLAGINIENVQETLRKTHSEVHPFVGRNLASFIKGEESQPKVDEPIYFMTDDEATKGLNQTTIQGEPYSSVSQPNHLETIIIKLPTGRGETEEIWKYTRYFDNPQFWSTPNSEDIETQQLFTTKLSETKEATMMIKTIKTEPVEAEFELYNLTRDPLEEFNLVHPLHQTAETKLVQLLLSQVLKQQRKKKRISPSNK
ncbi:arylsulfatase [Ureibacillus sinduriensis BLB-1 = JCM 15800]|uniref:Arylsulfatase n=1 Tax=Ureibacillus sinduriensis BLB-1 = JCM 15800 TaxID=1384057 RepID=A0A0A3ILB4_9BACL|nr:sulfatase-like hydrolase/transferase [Ureibacillus sinduriensis]KGR75622.1 arylsulfatase [Ureibacillus sinduriensis BLB-1 = JCM 15800]